MIITGIYRGGIQSFLKAKADADKKSKEQQEAEKTVTLDKLKEMNAQLERENKRLRDENRALHILCEEDNDSGDVFAHACG